jgi:arylsulfatase A-like enzyme
MIKTSQAFSRLVFVSFVSSLLALGLYGILQSLMLFLLSDFFPLSGLIPRVLLYLGFGLLAGAAAALLAGLLQASGLKRALTDLTWFKILFGCYLAGHILLHTFIGLYKNFNRASLTSAMFGRLLNPSVFAFLIITVLFFVCLYRFLGTRKKWSELWILMTGQFLFFGLILPLSLFHERIFKVLLKFHWLVFLKASAAYLVILAAGGVLFYLLLSGLYRFWKETSLLSPKVKPAVLGALLLLPLLVCISYHLQSGRDRSRANESAASKPNIIFIVIDTLRADRLGCYGHSRPTSPNIDRIAREGVLFETAVAPGAWTLPTHASMFSGMYSSKHGAHLEHFNLDRDITTMAEYFSGQGYYTAGFCNNGWVSTNNGFDQGFQSYFQLWKALTIRHTPGGLLKQIYFRNRYRHDRSMLAVLNRDAEVTNKFVCRWVGKHYGKKYPLFLFINYMDVHGPYMPPRTISYPFLDDSDLGKQYKLHPAYFHFNQSKYDENTLAHIRLLYDGGIYYLDHHLGLLFEKLSGMMSLDDTVVVITSDHGESLGENSMMGHDMSLYNTLVRVPLIIRYPKRFRPGTVITTPVQTVDIFPTLAGIVRPDLADLPPGVQGRPLLGPAEGINRPFLISEYFLPRFWIKGWKKHMPEIDEARIDFFDRRIKSIEDGDYKYIWYSDGTAELYNVVQDPYEEHNLIDLEPDVAAALKDRLMEWLGSFEHREAEGDRKDPVMDEETRESLRALGYLS